MFENPWYWISFLGYPKLWLLISFGLICVYFVCRFVCSGKSKWESIKMEFKDFIFLLFVTLILVFLFTIILKSFTQIPRPCIPCSKAVECNPYCPEDYSFPSGHTATIFSVVMLLYKFLKKRKFLPIFIIPFLVGYSRIALGVHRVADVIIGALLGIIIAYFMWRVRKLYK